MLPPPPEIISNMIFFITIPGLQYCIGGLRYNNIVKKKNHILNIYTIYTQRAYDVVITLLWRQNDVATFRCHIIFVSCVRWVII